MRWAWMLILAVALLGCRTTGSVSVEVEQGPGERRPSGRVTYRLNFGNQEAMR